MTCLFAALTAEEQFQITKIAVIALIIIVIIAILVAYFLLYIKKGKGKARRESERNLFKMFISKPLTGDEKIDKYREIINDTPKNGKKEYHKKNYYMSDAEKDLIEILNNQLKEGYIIQPHVAMSALVTEETENPILSVASAGIFNEHYRIVCLLVITDIVKSTMLNELESICDTTGIKLVEITTTDVEPLIIRNKLSRFLT